MIKIEKKHKNIYIIFKNFIIFFFYKKYIYYNIILYKNI